MRQQFLLLDQNHIYQVQSYRKVLPWSYLPVFPKMNDQDRLAQPSGYEESITYTLLGYKLFENHWNKILNNLKQINLPVRKIHHPIHGT